LTLEIVIDLTDESDANAKDESLVARAWLGDDGALAHILERYRGFVRGKARSYFLVGADREDVVQEGMIGLYKAIRDFDPSHESSFRAFADLCVTRQIITAIKSATRQKHGPLNSAVSLHVSVLDDEADGGELMGSFASDAADPCDRVVSIEELADLERRFADILSELECEVLQRYIDGQSYAEIADALQRHVKTVDNALQRIKRKLDGALQSRDLEYAV
jgi:RNA polymerase sporulation-specific sigma factor